MLAGDICTRYAWAWQLWCGVERGRERAYRQHERAEWAMRACEEWRVCERWRMSGSGWAMAVKQTGTTCRWGQAREMENQGPNSNTFNTRSLAFSRSVSGMHGSTRQEEVIDHRLTDREWAEEWKHLDHVRKVITFFITIQSVCVWENERTWEVCLLVISVCLHVCLFCFCFITKAYCF